MDPQSVSRILSEVAAAGLDPSRWPNVLSLLSEAGHVKTNFVGWDQSRTATQVFLTHGHDPSYIQTFAEHFADRNPWTKGFFELPLGTAISADGLYPYADLCRTEFHADWLVPQGNLSMGGGIMFLNEPGRTLILGGVGERSWQDKAEQNWLDLMQMVAPALRQSCEMNRLLAHLSLYDALRGTAEESFGGSILVVMNSNRRVLLANRLAERELASGDLLHIDANQRLAASNPTDSATLDSRIRQLILRPIGSNGFHLHDRSGVPSHECRVAHFIDQDCAFAPLGPAPIEHSGLLILIARPIDQIDGIEQKLRAAFGLSETEAAVAVALAEGLDSTSIAALRRVSIHTVRNQLKSAISKAGLRRQADLVGAIEKMRRR